MPPKHVPERLKEGYEQTSAKHHIDEQKRKQTLRIRQKRKEAKALMGYIKKPNVLAARQRGMSPRQHVHQELFIERQNARKHMPGRKALMGAIEKFKSKS